ncbi:hypothetical protein BKH43_08290 [Helicobacter sp. 13S00401-1]|nr:hypothetical protein BKH43_08290 [Helicobacter sp. 13S00401-1]
MLWLNLFSVLTLSWLNLEQIHLRLNLPFKTRPSEGYLASNKKGFSDLGSFIVLLWILIGFFVITFKSLLCKGLCEY